MSYPPQKFGEKTEHSTVNGRHEPNHFAHQSLSSHLRYRCFTVGVGGSGVGECVDSACAGDDDDSGDSDKVRWW